MKPRRHLRYSSKNLSNADLLPKERKILKQIADMFISGAKMVGFHSNPETKFEVVEGVEWYMAIVLDGVEQGVYTLRIARATLRGDANIVRLVNHELAHLIMWRYTRLAERACKGKKLVKELRDLEEEVVERLATSYMKDNYDG